MTSMWPPGVPAPPTEAQLEAARAVVREEIKGSFVSGFRLEFGEDSNGEKAVWIFLQSDSERSWSKDDERKIYELTSRIREKILNSEIGLWPYIDVEEVGSDDAVS
ncbi:hypothetical protein [Stella sp.]|uniref:hypothetical protein n=1 Tax=Stella sp. TaxID=2912054 RepID=UPI0035AF8E0D